MNRQDAKTPRRPFHSWRLGVLAVAFFLFFQASCDRSTTPPPAAKHPTIASLVPNATDLLLGMDAADHLLAVSNWEQDRPEIHDLPRVGDYQNADWEKLAALRPDVMIIFMSNARIPAGLKDRADQLHIELVNVSGTERLEDIYQLIDQLGDITHERAKATVLLQKIRGQLDAVAARVAGQEKIPTLITQGEEQFDVIAGNTFVDDLLSIAGGKNVAHDFKLRYPTVDREKVMEMSPQVIVQLLPAQSPQVVEQAKQSWQRLADLSAVKNNRVYILTDWYAIQPGSHVGDLAEKFADILHPKNQPTQP